MNDIVDLTPVLPSIAQYAEAVSWIKGDIPKLEVNMDGTIKKIIFRDFRLYADGTALDGQVSEDENDKADVEEFAKVGEKEEDEEVG